MYEHITAIANERVVTGDDFRPLIGQSNWLTMDADDIPANQRCDRENLLAMSGIDVGYVCSFTVKAVTPDDSVLIAVNIDDLVPGGTHMWMDADELAIRIEDA